MGKDGRFDVSVTFDERRGYVARSPELRAPLVTLSLGGLHRQIESAMMPDEVVVMLKLDKAARLERDRPQSRTYAASMSREAPPLPPASRVASKKKPRSARGSCHTLTSCTPFGSRNRD
jgi:hypothetical protein